MKKLNLKNAQKLSREAQKQISGGKDLPCQSGCVFYYMSDMQGSCFANPCNTVAGSEIYMNGRWQCCF